MTESATAFASPVKALVRSVPDSFAQCLHVGQHLQLDPQKARAQVKHYADMLTELGIAVIWVDSDEACPDACFIEDTAVVLDAGRVVLTHPGAASRRAEVPPVAKALQDLGFYPDNLDLPEATLDGGDVLRIGNVLLVGISGRTNQAGADALARVAAPLGIRVMTQAVDEGLHLKSAMTLLARDRAVILAGTPVPEGFPDIHWIEVAESAGANVLALGKHILVSDAAPDTFARLSREKDLVIHRLDVSELHKADGALTCLSLRFPAQGHWCT